MQILSTHASRAATLHAYYPSSSGVSFPINCNLNIHRNEKLNRLSRSWRGLFLVCGWALKLWWAEGNFSAAPLIKALANPSGNHGRLCDDQAVGENYTRRLRAHPEAAWFLSLQKHEYSFNLHARNSLGGAVRGLAKKRHNKRRGDLFRRHCLHFSGTNKWNKLFCCYRKSCCVAIVVQRTCTPPGRNNK